MKTTMTFNDVLFMAAIIFFPSQSRAQNLEVVGQAKITVMNTDNTATNVVVKKSDGTLAVRDASTLSGQSTGNYGTVVNPITGKVWLDRNLGATQVAVSSTDVASYGDLYQWGRNAEGHQIRTSGITTAIESNYFTTNGLFITNNTSPYNWLSNVETHMWSGTAAENNPCPSGFRIPTAAEWEQERRTWLSNDAAGAFGSPLKLPLAGRRDYSNGSLDNVDSFGFYWSSTVSSTNSRRLLFNGSNANIDANIRAFGESVRCLKD